jgi:integrase/recombinase XerD
MQTSPPDNLHERVAKLWRVAGRTPGTITLYLQWVRRFRVRFGAAGDGAMLTRDRVDAFAAAYVGPRIHAPIGARANARSALRAWSCALRSLGVDVPVWSIPPRPPPLPPMLARFVEYRLKHGGISPSTVPGDVRYVSEFIAFLRKLGRRPDAVRIVDVDAFVAACCLRMTRKTVGGVCSSLRAFLRFRLAVGGLRHDLAPSVVGPRIRAADRPPRAMPWKDVQRLLRAIDVRAQLGRRDFAMLLTMATYGMGAGEVLGLRIDNVDWRARTLRVRRPKTGTAIVLPLLDPIARALADYMRHERPAHAAAREIFVSRQMPYRRLTGASAIRHRIVKHAAVAGLTAIFLGSHVLRHSHACRQIESGAPSKVVSDILGHRRPSSTSAYVRVAVDRLRGLALPVPT